MAPVEGVYGYLLRDPEDDDLFIRPLGRGASCQTQLVHNYTTNSTCVRKVLRCPALPNGPTRGAAKQFDRDARVARLLHAAAAEDGFELRVPELLSAASTPHGCRVSHWGFCNGGTVFSFLERCSDTGSVLPVGLALHILVQTLETLDFMYTKLDTVCPCHPLAHTQTSKTDTTAQPIFHTDLHANNLMLDFAAGYAIPSVYVIDFGLATHCPPAPGDPASSTSVPDWDIADVLTLLCKRLTPLTLPRAKVRELHASAKAAAAAAGHKPPSRHDTMAAYLRRPPHDPDDTSEQAPLRTAYRQLRKLQRTFDARQAAALDSEPDASSPNASHPDQQTTPPPPPPRMRVPSLQPAITQLRRAAVAALWDVEQGARHAAFRAAVLQPARERARALGAERPRLWPTVGGLLAWLEGLDGVGVGPWDVAAVDARDPAFPVRGVLPGQVREVEDAEEEDVAG
ncbi:hypothetical protein B0I37DRAFT_242014 [Chaetomium sp. MPI-CAGE-AT-0009]|nr:hypothetical protein B0I37DRAFT_242014 [Chaetomium sp. MPI-CAGE-AT-0009]